MTTLVEEMAKAIFKSDFDWAGLDWDTNSDAVKEGFRQEAQAALDCVLKRLREPDHRLCLALAAAIDKSERNGVEPMNDTTDILRALATHLDQEGNLPAGAPETAEIEITPEMIEAGILAYLKHDSRFDDDNEAVRQVFLAMMRARRP
jgi:hypothetical protein